MTRRKKPRARRSSPTNQTAAGFFDALCVLTGVVYVDHGVSRGMAYGIASAKAAGRTVGGEYLETLRGER